MTERSDAPEVRGRSGAITTIAPKVSSLRELRWEIEKVLPQATDGTSDYVFALINSFEESARERQSEIVKIRFKSTLSTLALGCLQGEYDTLKRLLGDTK